MEAGEDQVVSRLAVSSPRIAACRCKIRPGQQSDHVCEQFRQVPMGAIQVI
jgi:hypothetical protein